MTDATEPGSGEPVLIGADYSVYTRIVRLALHLKGVAWRFEALDVFARDGAEKARRAGNPFGKIPVFRHAGLTLYETLAITRYIDEAFEGPALQPNTRTGRARMNQIVSIVDTQAYPVLVWGLHVPASRAVPPQAGMVESGHGVLAVLEHLADEAWLCGAGPTLANIYLSPCYAYVLDSVIGVEVQNRYPRLQAWWKRASLLPQTG